VPAGTGPEPWEESLSSAPVQGLVACLDSQALWNLPHSAASPDLRHGVVQPADHA